MPRALGAAVSQDAEDRRSETRCEDRDAPLEAVEADIDANKFGETESRLISYLAGPSGFFKSLLRSWFCAIQNS